MAKTLTEKTHALLAAYRQKKLRIVTAESCTGGLLTALLTEIPGASDVVERGFIVYSNQAKIELLGVSEMLLAEYGAVSRETAIAMAKGALSHSHADISIAITGIAGPEGGSPDKPVGTVHIATASTSGEIIHQAYIFKGTRNAVRLQAVEEAVNMLLLMS